MTLHLDSWRLFIACASFRLARNYQSSSARIHRFTTGSNSSSWSDSVGKTLTQVTFHMRWCLLIAFSPLYSPFLRECFSSADCYCCLLFLTLVRRSTFRRNTQALFFSLSTRQTAYSISHFYYIDKYFPFFFSSELISTDIPFFIEKQVHVSSGSDRSLVGICSRSVVDVLILRFSRFLLQKPCFFIYFSPVRFKRILL